MAFILTYGLAASGMGSDSWLLTLVPALGYLSIILGIFEFALGVAFWVLGSRYR